MGLFDRMKAEEELAMRDLALTEMQDEEERRARITAVMALIDRRVGRLGESLETETTALTTKPVFPRYYELSDLYLAARPFTANSDMFAPDAPERDIHQAVYVDLIGLNLRTGALEQRRIGVLGWLSYDGVRQAFKSSPPDVAFDPEGTAIDRPETLRSIVIKTATQSDRFICGKPILTITSLDVDKLGGADGLTAELSPEMINRIAAQTSQVRRCNLDAGHSQPCDPDYEPTS